MSRMIPRTRCVAGTILVAFSFAAAGIALAQAQDDPTVLEISSKYTIDRENGYTEFCIKINADRFEGMIFDVEFIGAWAPPITTPLDRFGPPGQWEWEPFGGGGWQAKTGVAMSSDADHCFRLPITSLPDPVMLKASTKLPSGNHTPIFEFVSTPPDYRSARGDVPRNFTFGEGQVAALGVLSPADVACRPQPIEDQFVLGTPRRGVLTIRRSQTGETASGRVDALGHFRAAGETSSFVGRIRGKEAIVGYRNGRLPACEQSFVGRLDLPRAGRAAPACRRPTIVAPTRARVRRSRISLRVAASCAGAPLSRWPMVVTLRSGGTTFKVGSFRTTLAPRSLVVQLGDTRPRALIVRANAGQGLAAATRRIRLLYG